MTSILCLSLAEVESVEIHPSFYLEMKSRAARLDQRGEIGIGETRRHRSVQTTKRHNHRLSNLIEAEAKRRGVRFLRVNAASDAVGLISRLDGLGDFGTQQD